MLTAATVERLLEATSAFTLLDPRFKPQLEKATPKIEQRLKQDPVARARNVKTVEEFIKFVEDIPQRLNRPQLMDKAYLRWIFEKYGKGGIGSISDMDQAWENFTVFHAGKSRLAPGERDINRYRTLQDLDQLVDKMQSTGQTKSRKREKMDLRKEQLNQLIQKGEVKHVFEDDRVTVYSPKTYEAAKFLGIGTRWCTGGESGSSASYFRDYSKDGPLYDIFFKKASEKLSFSKGSKKIQGTFPKRYQIHFESTSYANAADNSVDPEKIRKEAPSLKKAFPNKAEFNPNLSEADAFKDVSKRPRVLKYIKKPSDRVVLKAIDKGGIELLKDVDSRYITPKLQIDIVKQDPNNIQHITRPTVEAAKTAIDLQPESALFINPLTEELARYACSKDKTLLDYCEIFLEEEK